MPRLVVSLAGAVGWVVGAYVSRRSMGWWPSRTSMLFLEWGWVAMFLIGLPFGFLSETLHRWNVSVTALALSFVIPLVASHALPGIKPGPEDTIPGRPWLAISAARLRSNGLYLMKGSPNRVIAFRGMPWMENAPTLSADRRHIAYSANEYGNYDLFVMDLDGNGSPTRIRRLTDDPFDEGEPSWSPDGSRIAYTVRDGDSSTIELIAATGGASSELTAGQDAANPAWSPDGRKIAYSAASANDSSNIDIWLMSVDVSERKDVIDTTSVDWEPHWSPDGTRIAFTGAFNGSWDVYVANIDGSNVRDLTAGSTDKDLAFGWSPVGSKVLFLSDRSHGGGTFLYFMNADGSNVRLALRL